ncbi:MAG: hypothetical protein V3U52_06675 [Thermoplasmata archaeon]
MSTPSPAVEEPSPEPPRVKAAAMNPGGALVSDRTLTIVVFLFGFLVLIAAILLQLRFYIEAESFETAEAYQDFMRNMAFIGIVLIDVAIFFLVVFTLLVSLQRTDLNKWTRVAFMAFTLIVFLVWWSAVIIQNIVFSTLLGI